MGAPYGNMNASKYKPLYDALRKAIVQDDRARLDVGAQKLLDKVAEGDLQATQFVRDTLEGKPAQAMTLANEEGQSFRVDSIVRKIVRAND